MAFSYWLASAVLLDQYERCCALYCEDVAQRLRDLLRLLQRSCDERADAVCCAECGSPVSAMHKSFAFGEVGLHWHVTRSSRSAPRRATT